ncbi:MAG: hypothetical protein KA338_01130 [Chloroflexi bacterium]|nr:hypothetical protein [Chloroflexota bacterium]
MQAIKLKIPGTYYDSQIYAGLLYLWTVEGSILTIDWGKLIQRLHIASNPHLEFAAFCAFQKNGHLYRDEWQLLFKDQQMKELLIKRFEELANHTVDVTSNDLRKCAVQEQNNPFEFPHTDSLIYYSTIYVSGSAGLSSSQKGGNKNPINPKIIKHWDAPILGIAAKHKALAIAAGSEGMYEAVIDPDNDPRMFKNQQRSMYPSKTVRWLYNSLFSTSYQGGYVADIDVDIVRDLAGKKTGEKRILREVFSANELFNSKNEFDKFTWGVHDKICLADQLGVNVMKYFPEIGKKPRFDSLGHIKIDNQAELGLVNADSAPFGYVIEYDDRLLILDSQLNHLLLENEPVNWRVFPDSKDYANHLHVIYDDHLAVFSFVQDYFVDQENKIAGIQRSRGPQE